VRWSDWYDRAVSNGIEGRAFETSAWSLMTGEFALAELEDKDERLPDDTYRGLDDIKQSDNVRVTSAGAYYLEWLIYDIGYLQCVLQDTVMPDLLANELSQTPSGLYEVVQQVERFIVFLSAEEDKERAQWGRMEIEAFAPKFKLRLDRQRAAIT